MAETKEVYEAGNQEADPFSEEVTPAIQYVVDRWKGLTPGTLDHQQTLIIEGRVTKMVVRWELLRQVAGEFTGDKVVANAELELGNQKCDIVVEKPLAKIQEARSDLSIVGEVFRRFGRELDLQTYDLIVEHNKTVYALNDGVPKPTSRVDAPRKEVTTEQPPSQPETI